MRLLPRRRNTDLTLPGFRRWPKRRPTRRVDNTHGRQHGAPFLSMLSTWPLVFAYSHAVASRVTLSPKPAVAAAAEVSPPPTAEYLWIGPSPTVRQVTPRRR